jgi:predicted transposase YbfD/YdcC
MLTADAAAEEFDCGHGCVERRICTVLADTSLVEQTSQWPSLRGLVRVEAARSHKLSGKTEPEIRYYITSLSPNAARLNAVIRQHLGLENKLHWALDVGFGEDQSRKRARNSARNFSLLNRIALNLLRQETSLKRGIKGKPLKDGWDRA